MMNIAQKQIELKYYSQEFSEKLIGKYRFCEYL